MGRKIPLLRSYGSRWGPGKVHLAVTTESGQPFLAACTGKFVHAERIQGARADVTCRRCGVVEP